MIEYDALVPQPVSAEDRRPTVSIIVPVFNGGETFKRCLDGLKQLEEPGVEVIIVDDGSTDTSAELAKTYGFRVLQTDMRRGPATALNMGASVASGDILFFTDSDVLVPPDFLARALAHFARNPQLAGLIGSYDDTPSQANFISQYRNLLHHFTHQSASPEAQTFWGACGLVRRPVFLSQGGFNERFKWPEVEDIEFGYRLREAGEQLALVKDLQVKHLKRWTFASVVKADLVYRAIPWTRTLLEHRKPLNHLNVSWPGQASVALMVLALLVATPLVPGNPFILPLLLGGLTVVNIRCYRFFVCKKGLLFTAAVVPLHWGYFVICALGFLAGGLMFLLLPESNRLLSRSFAEAGTTLPTPASRNE